MLTLRLRVICESSVWHIAIVRISLFKLYDFRLQCEGEGFGETLLQKKTLSEELAYTSTDDRR